MTLLLCLIFGSKVRREGSIRLCFHAVRDVTNGGGILGYWSLRRTGGIYLFHGAHIDQLCNSAWSTPPLFRFATCKLVEQPLSNLFSLQDADEKSLTRGRFSTGHGLNRAAIQNLNYLGVLPFDKWSQLIPLRFGDFCVTNDQESSSEPSDSSISSLGLYRTSDPHFLRSSSGELMNQCRESFCGEVSQDVGVNVPKTSPKRHRISQTLD